MSLISPCACTRVHSCIGACLRGESGRRVTGADGSPRIRLGGAGEDPAVGRALTHLGGLCGWAFDQEHHRDGIRDGAVIWNGSVLRLPRVFSCLHICVCLSFSGHQVGCGAPGFPSALQSL